MRPLEQRKQEFKRDIWEACGSNEEKYTKDQMKQFFIYWSQHNKVIRSNTKMLFEKQPMFQMSNRLATFFKSNPKRYAKRKEKKYQDNKERLRGL